MDVQYPGFGSIVVEGKRFDHDVVIESGQVRPRDKKPSRPLKRQYGHTPLSAAEDLPWTAPKLVVGTGHSGRLPILDDIRTAAADHHVELVELPTAEACQLLRDLDPSEFAAVLHVTC